MSQTSMRVRQRRAGVGIEEKGLLPAISEYGGEKYLTTTCVVHFMYHDDAAGKHHLKEVTIAAIPNGMLQDRYNPTPDDGIWFVGGNAPSRGEDFRARLGFAKLKQKAVWRTQVITYDENTNTSAGSWRS